MTETLLHINIDGCPVVDADEEIFLLYTAINQSKSPPTGPGGYRGLGHIDSLKSTLAVRFDLQSPVIAPRSSKPMKPPRKNASEPSQRTIEFEVVQDPTALRSRNGDTGSVVWRATTELAKALLQQHFFPPELPLLNRERLAQSHCLELGSGTGLLGLALAPLVCTYTATDAAPLLPLIRKNISLNLPSRHLGVSTSNIAVEELDWLACASLPRVGPSRQRYCPVPSTHSPESHDHTGWDLIIAIDCIYNPSLLPALVDTIDTLATVGRTWVLVVAELRQEDVPREFLSLWLNQSGGKWQISRVDSLLDAHFVVWAGRKC